ncbi:MAG: hypothetical protein ACRDJH_08430 [Thermomicrobiales bacterium]
MRVHVTQLTRRQLMASALLAGAVAVAAPDSSSGQEATPAASTGATSVFAELLAGAPDVLEKPERPAQIAMFGDVAAQLASVGARQSTALDDSAIAIWIPATQGIPIPNPARNHGGHAEFRARFGFDLIEIDQGLDVGEPPEMITFLRGRFEEDALRAAWSNAGHQRIDVDGQPVFSLAEDPEFSRDHPVQQLAQAQYNNVALLPDGTLVYAPTLDLLRSVIAVIHDTAPSLAARAEVASLLSTVEEPLGAAALLDGEVLSLPDSRSEFDPRMNPEKIEQLRTLLEQSGQIPPVRIVLFGVTPGGPIRPPERPPRPTPIPAGDPAIFVIRLLMADAAAAETAAETIPKRLQTLDSLVTEKPYSELVTLRRIEAMANPPVVMLDLDFVMPPHSWFRFVGDRDLLFLGY